MNKDFRERLYEDRRKRDEVLKTKDYRIERIRDRLRDRALGITMLACDRAEKAKDLILCFGYATEPLYDIEGFRLLNSLVLSEEEHRRLRDMVCLVERGGFHKVIGVSKSEFLLTRVPGGNIPDFMRLFKDIALPKNIDNKISRDLGDPRIGSRVKEMFLSPRSPAMLFVLGMMAPYLEGSGIIFDEEVVRTYLPLGEANWGAANGVDLLFTIHVMSYLENFSNFDLCLVGLTHGDDPLIPAWAMLVDLLERERIIEPEAERGVADRIMFRGVLAEDEFSGASSILIGADYVKKSSLSMQDVEEHTKRAIDNAIRRAGVSRDDIVGIELTWILNSADMTDPRDCAEEAYTTAYQAMPQEYGDCRHTTVYVLPLITSMVIAEVWVRPRSLITGLANSKGVIYRERIMETTRDRLNEFREKVPPETNWRDPLTHIVGALDVLLNEILR